MRNRIAGSNGSGLQGDNDCIAVFAQCLRRDADRLHHPHATSHQIAGQVRSRSSEIEVDRTGRTLYVSNRGEDTIGVFHIDQVNGKVTLIQSQSSSGKTPRFFALSLDGRWLYALNEESDSIVLFAVDSDTGQLRPADLVYPCGSPVCMVFSA